MKYYSFDFFFSFQPFKNWGGEGGEEKNVLSTQAVQNLAMGQAWLEFAIAGCRGTVNSSDADFLEVAKETGLLLHIECVLLASFVLGHDGRLPCPHHQCCLQPHHAPGPLSTLTLLFLCPEPCSFTVFMIRLDVRSP